MSLFLVNEFNLPTCTHVFAACTRIACCYVNVALILGLHQLDALSSAPSCATMARQGLLWQTLKQVITLLTIVLTALLAQKQRFAVPNVGIVLLGGKVTIDALPRSQR